LRYSMKVIDSFRGQYDFLSNFSPYGFCDNEGKYYKTVEHFFQSQKTKDFEEREKIRKAKSPKQAKARGRKVKLRKDWDEIKDRIMYTGLKLKFHQNPDIKEKLLETGNCMLVEGNWWGDTYWGICNGNGENKLGKLLMLLRYDYRKQEETVK